MDCFLCEGLTVLFRIGLAIFKVKEERILATTDQHSLIVLLKSPIVAQDLTSGDLVDVCILLEIISGSCVFTRTFPKTTACFDVKLQSNILYSKYSFNIFQSHLIVNGSFYLSISVGIFFIWECSR